MKTEIGTPITESWLVRKGFISFKDTYDLPVKINSDLTKASIFAFYDEANRWVAFYFVNGFVASKCFYTSEEVDSFMQIAI